MAGKDDDPQGQLMEQIGALRSEVQINTTTVNRLADKFDAHVNFHLTEAGQRAQKAEDAEEKVKDRNQDRRHAWRIAVSTVSISAVVSAIFTHLTNKGF